ncbi:MAG: hypothetical protein Q7S21_02020 [archaeon]|nr:hypothetical protein [archaeon]
MRTIICLILLLIASGCISNSEPELRLACLEFSAPNASVIAGCETQNSCLKKLDKEFFEFDSSLLSFATQKQLNEFKYAASLAWFYQNETLKNLNEINKVCAKREYSLLPEKVNEFKNNAVNGFGFLDKANQKAVAVLVALRGELEKEGINSAKEEELFNDYIKVNNNLIQFSSEKEMLTTDSFAGIVLSQSKKLNDLTAKLESKQFVQETTALEAVNAIDQDVLRLWKDKSFYVPLTKNIATSFASLFAEKESLLISLGALNGISIEEILSVFNELNFGSMKQFSQLMQSTAKHKKELVESSQKLENSIKENLLLSAQKTDALNEFFSKTNSDSLQFALSLREKTISVKSFDLSGGKFKASAENKLLELQKRFSELQQKKALKQISLGKEALELKQLNNDLLQLNSELEELSKLNNELVQVCEGKVSLIKKQNKSNSDELSALIDAKIAVFEKEKEFNEKLFVCSQIVSLNEQEQKRVEQMGIFSSWNSSSCLQEISKLAELEQLQQFKERVNALKESLENSNSAIAIDDCGQIKTQLLQELENNPEIAELNLYWEQANQAMQKLQKINAFSPSNIDQSDFAKRTASFEEIQRSFKDNKFNPLQGAEPEQLMQKLSLLKQNIDSLIVESLQKFFETNFEREFFALEIPEIGEQFELTERLSFNNVFFFYKRPFSVSIVLKNASAAPKSFSENVLNARIVNKKVIIDFSSLPEGKSFVDFNETETISIASKKETINETNSVQLVRERISLNSIAVLPKALFRKKFEQIPSEINVLASGESIDFLLQGNEILFFVPVKENTNIELLYRISKIVQSNQRDNAKILTEQQNLYSLLEQGIVDADYLKQNFPDFSKNFEAKILQAKQLLTEAEKFILLNQYGLAQNRQAQAKKLLLFRKETALFESIEQERKQIETKTKKIIQQNKAPDSEFSGLVQLFDETNSDLLFAISANDLNNSIELIEQLKRAAESLSGQQNFEAKNKVLELSAEIDAIKQIIADENFFSVLELADSSFVQSQPLIYSKFQILEIKQELEQIAEALGSKEIEEFQSLVREERFEDALLLSQNFGAKISSALKQAKLIKQRLESIQKNLQGNSEIVLEKLRQKVLKSPTKENVQALLKAEEALKEKDFESFSQMAGFLLIQESTLPELPLILLVPVIIGTIALVGVKALAKKKGKEQKTPLKLLKPRN